MSDIEASSVEVRLMSSDGQLFVVKDEEANMSGTLKNMREDMGDDGDIPLPNVNSKVLTKVIEYWKHKQAAKKPAAAAPSAEATPDAAIATSDADKAWVESYLDVDQATLFDLILAANYLNCKELLDMTCKAVANMIKGKTPEEIRKLFNIKNDFTPEEEEDVRKENQWAFD